MSALLENKGEAKLQTSATRSFHLHMAYACLVLVVVTWISCRLTSIEIPSVADFTIGMVFACAVVLTISIFWHEKGKTNLRDSILTIPWEIFLAGTVPLLVLAAAKSNMPLRDASLMHADQLLGINVPKIMAWCSHHWIGIFVTRTYPLLSPLITVSALLPAFTGKVHNAQQFLIANLIAFAIGLPLYALLPAIGPWYGYGISPTHDQLQLQSAVLAFRGPGHSMSQLTGIICFPSFHVIWAITCVAALWGYRILRIPVGLLASMIVVSTVTTGWHYFTDVLGGVAIVAFSLFAARCYLRKSRSSDHRLEVAALCEATPI
jgi:membrane-associated phospholipid phosphatase